MATRPSTRRYRHSKTRCRSGKRTYPDQETADEMLTRIWSRCGPGRRLECRAYHCGRCGQWHLTSMPLAS